MKKKAQWRDSESGGLYAHINRHFCRVYRENGQWRWSANRDGMPALGSASTEDEACKAAETAARKG